MSKKILKEGEKNIMTWEIFQPEENRQPYTPTGMSLDAYKGGFKRDSPKKRDLNIWKHTP